MFCPEVYVFTLCVLIIADLLHHLIVAIQLFGETIMDPSFYEHILKRIENLYLRTSL